LNDHIEQQAWKDHNCAPLNIDSIARASLNDEKHIFLPSVQKLLQLVPFKRFMAASSVPWPNSLTISQSYLKPNS
jgi:hypothetical protein